MKKKPIDKYIFVHLFSLETGFPDLEKTADIMDKEIKKGIYELSEENNFGVKFIGYDSNCSVGRKCALPGSDCDGLFIIIEPNDELNIGMAPEYRWKLKDKINQRIVSTPPAHLPEVLTTDYISQGLDVAAELFNGAEFNADDLKRFEGNLADNSKDFVKSAEFDIRMAQMLPPEKELWELFYKTAMFVEIIRDGHITENNLSCDLLKKIKKSPLYKYSNIMKQQGLKNSEKQKHILRRKMSEQFNTYSEQQQYDTVRDIIHSSLGLPDVKHKELFSNNAIDGSDETGNITEMYKLLTGEE